MEMETETETDTETETEYDVDMDTDMMVFEVTEIDLDYEFDAAHWFDFTREELALESRAAELWFETAQSYPPSRNGTRSGVFTFIQGGTLNKDPNESLHKGPTFSNRTPSDKLKYRPKSSIRPIPRGSTLMKPTASLLAKLDNARLQRQVDESKEKGLFPSTGSEMQSAKRQKLEGGLLRKVAEVTQETNLVHKLLKKDLDKNSLHARMKITVPQEPDFATSHRANRIRHRIDAKLEQDSTSVYGFKARPLNRKIFEAPSLPIRKKSTPKLPEFQEFRLKTSERAMQHSSAVSTSPYPGNNNRKESDKPNTTAYLDGVNREPRRPRAMDTPKDDDRKHLLKARPLNNKILSSGQDIGIFTKSKRETTTPVGFRFHSERRAQPNLPTDLFSKLSLSSELQQNNGSHSRFDQPEQKTSKFARKPMVQHCVIPETSRQWTSSRSGKLEAAVQLN
ncbi:PREDICTED: uncharacterized protein LOC104717972 isoform X2 [Camelina sativa]|uniref:Uncharacterized protein LOC104717972 isoform X2 n=1 Tax=Camelina sativa TaxID=90675 RepID=A0ABM0U065_CAMSA|nr:PREDICTED: uncharacterized protein LOC104717972 isoform X2 [Camelina sativa]